MRHSWIVVICLAGSVACTDVTPPLAPTPVAGPTPQPSTPSLPTNVPGVLALDLPIDSADAVSTNFGMTPFGYHAADHADTGHTGWDFEYRAGATARAAAAGAIEAVFVDGATGRFTVQVEHVVGNHHYRTTYSSVAALAPDIAQGEVVRAGQPLGTVAGVSHFQLDDFEYYRDLPAPNAVSAEPFLTPEAKAVFDRIWSTALYPQEFVEPLATNPRELIFPAMRTWTKAGGDGPAGLRFVRSSARSTGYEYAMFAESGTVIETGVVTIDVSTRPSPSINLVSRTATRAGIYDIVSNELRLALADPGEARPTSLGAAAIYRTK